MMVVSISLASVTEEGSLGSGALSVSVKSEVPQTGWINMTVYTLGPSDELHLQSGWLSGIPKCCV